MLNTFMLTNRMNVYKQYKYTVEWTEGNRRMSQGVNSYREAEVLAGSKNGAVILAAKAA